MSQGLPNTERTALDAIAADLAAERRVRKRRALPAGIAIFLIAMLFAVRAPIDPTSSTRLLMIAASAVLLVLWLTLSLSTRLRLPRVVPQLIAFIAVSVPLIAASEHAIGPEPAHSKCALLVFGFGLIASVALRVVLGKYARRFGGAEELMIAFASTLGALAIGLRCEGVSMIHLAVHSAAAAALIVVVSLLTRR